MSWEFEVVVEPSEFLEFTEGPVWNGESLLFSEIPSSRILQYNPQSGECSEFRTGTNSGNGLALDNEGRLYCCEGGWAAVPSFTEQPEGDQGEGRRITRYNPDGTTDVIADQFEGKRLNSPNDLAVDSLGRIWFTDPRYGDNRADMELDHESIYRCDPQANGSWTIERVTFDSTRPNGLIVTPDLQTLYVAQSEYGEDKKRELRAYAIHDDGTVGDYEVLHNFYPHRSIDGMCLDSEGHIVATAGWDTSGPGTMIYVFAPNGRVLSTHPIPHMPTNCCFGNDNLDSLYVTTFGGYLYRAQTDLHG